MMTDTQVIKEIRSTAKAAGLTFKRMNTRLNSAYMWKFIDRKTKEDVLWNCALGSAYDNCCSGYIDSYNTETRYFDGITQE